MLQLFMHILKKIKSR